LAFARGPGLPLPPVAAGRRRKAKWISVAAALLGAAPPAQALANGGAESACPRDVPCQAASAGYTHLVFSEDFKNFDLSPDGSGLHRWYQGLDWDKNIPPQSQIVAGHDGLVLKWLASQTKEPCETSIQTLALDHSRARVFRHGYFEFKIKWNPVPGSWPALWMTSARAHIHPGSEPLGEIDIFEGRGGDPVPTFHGTIHHSTGSRAGVADAMNSNSNQEVPGTDWRQWHVVGLLWRPGAVSWYLDDRLLMTAPTFDTNESEYLFLVLGSQEGLDWHYCDKSGVTASELDLHVQWVRVYQ
jgi:hypothetical protein